MNRAIRAVVVDDEPPARRRIARLLEEEGAEVVARCGDGETAVRAICEARPDVVFLDIRMPGRDGFEMLEDLPAEATPAVVFVTAHDEHAVRAFRARALDYLLKPVDRGRIAQALGRVREGRGKRASSLDRDALREALRELAETAPAKAAEGSGTGRRWLVSRGGRSYFLRAGEVDWIEAAGNYVRLHTEDASYLVRGTMSGFEEALDPGRFQRVHRSAIVNLDRVREMEVDPSGDGRVTMRDGTEVRLSRRYRRRLEERLAPPG